MPLPSKNFACLDHGGSWTEAHQSLLLYVTTYLNLDWVPVFILADKDRSPLSDPLIPLYTIIV